MSDSHDEWREVNDLDEMTEVIPLAAVPGLASQILSGAVRGRIVVDINA